MALDKIFVLQVINTARVGGGMGHLLSLMEKIDRGRFEMILATDGDSYLMDQARQMGVEIVTIRMMSNRANLLPALKLARLIRDKNIDIVHLHGTRAGFYGGLACKLARCKRSIYTVHGFSFNKEMGLTGKRFYMGIERYLSRIHPMVISVSETDRRQALQMELCPARRIRTIHNGIDLSRFSPDGDCRKSRESLGLPVDGILVGTLARLVPQKGLEYFIQAARAIAQVRKDVRFLLIGEGYLEDSLRNLAERLGIADMVIFTGPTNKAWEYYRSIDVFVLSSLWEGHPISLIEALAMRKPTVATRTSGSPEIIEDGVTGILVPPKDSRALKDAILWVIENPENASSMANQGRAFVERHFDVNSMVEKTAGVYEELMSQGEDPRLWKSA